MGRLLNLSTGYWFFKIENHICEENYLLFFNATQARILPFTCLCIHKYALLHLFFVVFLLSFCRRSDPAQWHVYHAQCFCQRDLTKQTSVEVFKVIPTFRSLKSPELRTQSWFGPSLLCSLLEGKHLKWDFWVLLSWIHLSQFMDTILVLQLGNFLAIAVGREYTTPLTKQTTSGTICILDFQTHFMNLNKFENGRKNFILKCWTFGKETFPIKCF